MKANCPANLAGRQRSTILRLIGDKCNDQHSSKDIFDSIKESNFISTLHLKCTKSHFVSSIEQIDVPVNVPVNLTKRRADILEQMGLNSSITVMELAIKFGVSHKTIKRDISSLKANGYITRVGSDKKGEW